MRNKDKELKKLANLLKRLPQEEPDRDSDKRFWTRFEAEKDALRPSSFGMSKYLIACSFFILLIAGYIFLNMFNPLLDRPSLSLIQGEVNVFDKAGNSIAEKEYDELREGYRIETNSLDWAILRLTDKYQMKISPNTSVQLLRVKSKLFNESTLYRLYHGQVLVSIRGNHGRSYPLEIYTSDFFASAKGTQFAVSWNPGLSEMSKVQVAQGLVHVGSLIGEKKLMDDIISIEAGEEVLMPKEGQSLEKQRIAESRLNELNEFFQFSIPDQAILLISMSDNRIDELLKPSPIYIYYKTKHEGARLMIEAIKKIQIIKASKNPEDHLDAVRELESIIPSQNPSNHIPLYLFTAAYFAHLGEFGEAVRIFDLISQEYRDSTFRSLALLASARIYGYHLNDWTHAERLALQILKEYPDSYEVNGARATLIFIRSSQNNTI